MNASFKDTTTPADAALTARWTRQIDTGADVFSVAELDRLAALTPANDARALAEIADCRAIEVELLGYDPAAPLVRGYDLCDACNGSGAGTYDGARCRVCGGTGEAHGAPLWDDEPASMDDDALVAYLAGAYESAVA